jgi:four helix bundle protein
MSEPTAKRKRTIALQERTVRFSVDVNARCPERFSNIPSRVVWSQLVRSADSVSNNLIEADDALSDADFLHKLGIALREAKESRTAMLKVRIGRLDNHAMLAERGLESEAAQLAAIFAAIIRNMRLRLETSRKQRAKR